MAEDKNRQYSSTTGDRPLWRIAWRRIRRRPIQYVLLVLGVALGVAMMVSVDVANGSAGRAFELSTDAVAGRTTHRIVGGPTGLDESVYRTLRRDIGFAPAAPVVEGFVLARELGSQPMRLVGIDPFAEPPFRSYFGDAESRSLEAIGEMLTTDDALIISETLAQRYELDLGDKLVLDVAGSQHTMRLVALLRPADGTSQQALDSIIFADIATAQEIMAMTGRLSHIDLIVDDDVGLAALTAALPAGARVETASARSNAVRQMAEAFQLNLTALSLLALVVGIFLIYNTVTFGVLQRRPLFAILRCLGVTGGQLFTLIMGEAAILSLVGALLGVGAGLLLGRGMVRLVSQTINDFYFVINVQSVAVPPWTLVRTAIIGLAAACGAALIPAWEAMRTAPQSGLRRSSLESKARRAVGWLLLAFVLLAAFGVFLLWLPNVSLILTFAGLFAVLIACAFLTPAVTTGLMTGLVPLIGRVLGTIGRMAPRDIVRSLSRTSVAIAALMIAVSVIVGVSIMIGSFRQTVEQWLGSTLQADVFVSPPALTANRIVGSLDAEVVDVLQSWPGVTRAVIARRSEILAPGLGRPVEVVAVSGDVSDGRRGYAWIAGEQSDLWPRFGRGEGIFVSEPLVIRENLVVPPEPISLMTEAGVHDFSVLAVFFDYSSDQGSILIDETLYRQWWGEAAATSVGLFLDEGRDDDDVTGELRERFAGRGDVVIQSNLAVRSNALDIFDRTFAITTALQLLAVLVAFIGVLSALLSLQLERTRELGVLRATGMTVRQMWQLTLMETGLMGSTAGLLAMPVGWVLAWILIYVINRRSFGWTLQMTLQPSYFLQALAVAVVAALLAGIYPAMRQGSIIIATAVREE